MFYSVHLIAPLRRSTATEGEKTVAWLYSRQCSPWGPSSNGPSLSSHIAKDPIEIVFYGFHVSGDYCLRIKSFVDGTVEVWQLTQTILGIQNDIIFLGAMYWFGCSGTGDSSWRAVEMILRQLFPYSLQGDRLTSGTVSGDRWMMTDKTQFIVQQSVCLWHLNLLKASAFVDEAALVCVLKSYCEAAETGRQASSKTEKPDRMVGGEVRLFLSIRHRLCVDASFSVQNQNTFLMLKNTRLPSTDIALFYCTCSWPTCISFSHLTCLLLNRNVFKKYCSTLAFVICSGRSIRTSHCCWTCSPCTCILSPFCTVEGTCHFVGAEISIFVSEFESIIKSFQLLVQHRHFHPSYYCKVADVFLNNSKVYETAIHNMAHACFI